jgi:tetratricopeptide (TPR) repeat protein
VDETFERLYEQAKALFDGGRYLEAEKIYEKLLKGRPQGYAEIFNKLGLIAHYKGELEASADYFQKALSINPRYTEASLNLTVTLNDLGRYDEAGDTFSKAAQVVRADAKAIDPFIIGKLANEHARLGDQYAEFGLYDEALEEYRKALALRPNFVDVITKEGIALREKGRLDEAIESFMRAKGVHPKYLPAMVHLGVTYYMKGFLDLARNAWEEAQTVDPENRDVQVYLSLAKKEIIEK